jgi:dihydrolipoamide dehydrogenase
MKNGGETRKLVVIGGGIGGYTAAIRAARDGLDVTLVESGVLGGTCLNVGCIPTKSLLHQAQVFREVGTLAHHGVDSGKLSVALTAVMARKNDAVQKLVQGVKTLVRRNRVTLVQGTAEFVGPKSVRVRETGALLEADAVVIASGSEPVVPPIPGVDLDGVVTSDGALTITALPQRALIIGGGVIGVEFAQIFSDFGVQVTVVEKLERLVSEEDAEVAGVLQRSLAQDGVDILTGSTVQAIRRQGKSLAVAVATPAAAREIVADLVLVAVGRRPRIKDLGLERAGITVQAGAIATDGYCRTSAPDVYAVGDARGGLLLAHKAAAEAECAVAGITGSAWSMDGRVVPRAVYTTPEIAAVGLTEVEAQRRYPSLKVGRFPFSASGKAITNGHVDGLVKVLADSATDQIVGIAMVGADVTNLLGEATDTAGTDGDHPCPPDFDRSPDGGGPRRIRRRRHPSSTQGGRDGLMPVSHD